MRPGDHAQLVMTHGNSETQLGRSGNETPENKRNSEKQTRMSPGAGRDSKVQGDKSGDLNHHSGRHSNGLEREVREIKTEGCHTPA